MAPGVYVTTARGGTRRITGSGTASGRILAPGRSAPSSRLKANWCWATAIPGMTSSTAWVFAADGFSRLTACTRTACRATRRPCAGSPVRPPKWWFARTATLSIKATSSRAHLPLPILTRPPQAVTWKSRSKRKTAPSSAIPCRTPPCRFCSVKGAGSMTSSRGITAAVTAIRIRRSSPRAP